MEKQDAEKTYDTETKLVAKAPSFSELALSFGKAVMRPVVQWWWSKATDRDRDNIIVGFDDDPDAIELQTLDRNGRRVVVE
ncbi:hypothetical protein TWF696_005309 [Orbilia brochopaga]|uniref:Uncharacterized protein n=1 Tax=Orbilia brochopaga TaxID=3140254 RepID=A0AAV9V6Z2_9PEZI